MGEGEEGEKARGTRSDLYICKIENTASMIHSHMKENANAKRVNI